MTSAAPALAAQLGFDFGMRPPGAPADPIEVRLVVEGLVPNHFVLDLNRGLTTPSDMALDPPWSLPSRLFRHPIAFIGGEHRPDGRGAILVRHPLLVGHPFVRQVAERLHQEPRWEPTDEFGRDFGALPRWWHAVDLMTGKHWRDLLETRRFTDDAAIADAVAHALLCGRSGNRNALTVKDAREVLAAIGAAEPGDWSNGALLGSVLSPAHIVERHPRTKKVERDEWAVNIDPRGPVGAWALVHGIEDGWFAHRRSGGLVMSAKGLRRRGLDREASPPLLPVPGKEGR